MFNLHCPLLARSPSKLGANYTATLDLLGGNLGGCCLASFHFPRGRGGRQIHNLLVTRDVFQNDSLRLRRLFFIVGEERSRQRKRVVDWESDGVGCLDVEGLYVAPASGDTLDHTPHAGNDVLCDVAQWEADMSNWNSTRQEGEGGGEGGGREGGGKGSKVANYHREL